MMNADKKQAPLSTLTASAKKLSKIDIKTKKSRTGTSTTSWQDDAWDMYDLVGEQRFLATNIAGQLAKARLYVGRYTAEGEEPTRLEKGEGTAARALLEALGGSEAGRSQILKRLAINLLIAGEGWLAGIPPQDEDEITGDDLTAPDTSPGRTPAGLMLTQRIAGDDDDTTPLDEIEIADLEWRMLSVSEVSINSSTEKVELSLDEGEKGEYDPDDLYLIRVWQPHPRHWWEADSPTRSSLPVLKELVGLTMHVSAQIDSRLAGAGILALPQSVQRALATQAGVDPETAGDQFSDGLIEAMLTPISDRASASAVVPLVVTMPDDAVDKIKHISFSTPLDEASNAMRDEAIRRLALGQDAPPELLLGTSGMNHWGGWLVQQETVSTHIEPILALICDAITTQYLWPALIDGGMEESAAQEHVIWYDVDHLIVRPNLGADALSLHEKGVLSDDALRRTNGFDDNDAPATDETTDEDPALSMVLDMVRTSPSLASTPGITALVEEIRGVLAAAASGGETPGAPSADETAEEAPENGEDSERPAGAVPDTAGDEATLPEFEEG